MEKKIIIFSLLALTSCSPIKVGFSELRQINNNQVLEQNCTDCVDVVTKVVRIREFKPTREDLYQSILNWDRKCLDVEITAGKIPLKKNLHFFFYCMDLTPYRKFLIGQKLTFSFTSDGELYGVKEIIPVPLINDTNINYIENMNHVNHVTHEDTPQQLNNSSRKSEVFWPGPG
jgi:hypothetical protein